MIVSLNGLQAAGSISGVELRGHVTSYLAEQGLVGAPALNSTRQFRACSADLQFSPLFGSFQTIEIRCPDNDGWKIAVRTRLEVATAPLKNKRHNAIPSQNFLDNQMAVVVNKRLTKNSIIGPDDISLEPVASMSSTDYFTRINDVVGRRVKRSLRTRQIVVPAALLIRQEHCMSTCLHRRSRRRRLPRLDKQLSGRRLFHIVRWRLSLGEPATGETAAA